MKRDMDLIRQLMFKIEDEYKGHPLYPFIMDGYEMWIVKEHCKLMYQQGLIEYVEEDDINNSQFFRVGNLTNEGYDLLEKIRQDTVWNKTKEAIKKKGLPMVVEVIKSVASSALSTMTEAAIKGMMNP